MRQYWAQGPGFVIDAVQVIFPWWCAGRMLFFGGGGRFTRRTTCASMCVCVRVRICFCCTVSGRTASTRSQMYLVFFNINVTFYIQENAEGGLRCLRRCVAIPPEGASLPRGWSAGAPTHRCADSMVRLVGRHLSVAQFLLFYNSHSTKSIVPIAWLGSLCGAPDSADLELSVEAVMLMHVLFTHLYTHIRTA